MNLAKVLGTVVSTRKEESIVGLKFLLLGNVNPQRELTGATVVAADAVGAGMGEMVLYAPGSSARQTQMTDQRPCALKKGLFKRQEFLSVQIINKGQPGLVHLGSDVDGHVHGISVLHDRMQFFLFHFFHFRVLDIPVAVRNEVQGRGAFRLHAFEHGSAVRFASA